MGDYFEAKTLLTALSTGVLPELRLSTKMGGKHTAVPTQQGFSVSLSRDPSTHLIQSDIPIDSIPSAIERLLRRVAHVQLEDTSAPNLGDAPSQKDIQRFVEEIVSILVDFEKETGLGLVDEIAKTLEMTDGPSVQIVSDEAKTGIERDDFLSEVQEFMSSLTKSLASLMQVPETLKLITFRSVEETVVPGQPGMQNLPRTDGHKSLAAHVIPIAQALREQLASEGKGRDTVVPPGQKGVAGSSDPTPPLPARTTINETLAFSSTRTLAQTKPAAIFKQGTDAASGAPLGLFAASILVTKSTAQSASVALPNQAQSLATPSRSQDSKPLVANTTNHVYTRNAFGLSVAEAAIAVVLGEANSTNADPSDLARPMLEMEGRGEILSWGHSASSFSPASTAHPGANGTSSHLSPSPPTGFSLALAEQIRNVHLGDGTTRVELSPRGLGTIEIEVITDADKSTNIVIRADNPTVLTSLRDIRDSLAQAINLADGGSLSFEDRSDRDAQKAPEDRGERSEPGQLIAAEDMVGDPLLNTSLISEKTLDIVT